MRKANRILNKNGSSYFDKVVKTLYPKPYLEQECKSKSTIQFSK